MAGTTRKDHGLFDHPHLQQEPPRRTGRVRVTAIVRGIWTFALMVVLLFAAADSAMADHTYLPWKIFKFTGAPAAMQAEMKQFEIYEDGALYFRLNSVTPAGNLADTVIGFMNTYNPNACSARYLDKVKNPKVGQTYGPYYMEAGIHKSYYYSRATTTLYELEIEYHPQLTPNDAEPNDLTTSASDIGDIDRNEHITGHLGYLGCQHNKHDYIRFGMLSTGNYQVKIHYDPAFRDKPDCKVWFALHDDTASDWVLEHEGPADVTLGPIAFHAGRKYLVSMESSDGCFDRVYESYTM